MELLKQSQFPLNTQRVTHSIASMDALTDEELTQVHSRINHRIEITDNGCWKWVGNYCRNLPRVHIGNTPYRPHRIMWMIYRPDEVMPAAVIHDCELGSQCINPHHKKPMQPKPKPEKTYAPRRRGRYRQHTSECPGPDWIVIERILSAGTIEIIPKGDTICDCERAWILQNTDFTAHSLAVSTTKAQRLLTLII